MSLCYAYYENSPHEWSTISTHPYLYLNPEAEAAISAAVDNSMATIRMATTPKGIPSSKDGSISKVIAASATRQVAFSSV
jgi:hypothetical protein